MDLVVESGNNITMVLFVCGQAFFAMGLAVALECRRPTSLRAMASLPLLAACGVLIGAAFWAEMLLTGQLVSLGDQSHSIRIVHLLLVVGGSLCAGQSGVELLAVDGRKRPWLRWLPAALFMVWLGGTLLAMAPSIQSALGPTGMASGLSDSSSSPGGVVASHDWISEANALAGYLLYLPGGLLVAVAMLRLRPVLYRMQAPRVARDATGAAVGFGLSAVVGGCVPEPASFFPASVVNSGSFYAVAGFPVQLVIAIAAVLTAWFSFRILRLFTIEEERQLHKVRVARYEAQRELLETQRTAQLQAERWNQELEAKIEQRTAELAKLNRDLETTHAIASAVSQSLRLEDVLNTTLDKTMEVLQVRVGGVHIVDTEAGTVKYSVSRGLYNEYLRRTDIVGMGSGFVERVIESDQPLLVKDISEAPHVAELVIEREGVQSFVSVPLKSKGRVLGAMSFVSHSPRSLTEDDVGLLRIIANQIAVAIDNAQLFEETQRREREAEALYRVGQQVSSLLDIDKILDSVVENARQLVGTEAAALALIDERTQEIYMKATKGIRTEAFKSIALRKGQGLAGRVIDTGKAVKIEDYALYDNITHEVDEIVRAEGLMAHLAAPLKMGEKVMGALYVLEHRVHHFSEHDASLLMGLASQAAIAIENARLYDQVQQLAVLSERGRIAREMHDGVAQVLGYLIMNSRLLANFLSEGRVVEAAEELERMREILREAYNDVRASILGLRTSASIDKGLMPGLLEYVEDFGYQTGIRAELVMGQCDGMAFAPAAETQLVRIVQEALTNTRKHAKASRVWVRIDLDGDQARIVIEDNGLGFHMNDRDQTEGHFGLEIMRERAESVGGSVHVESVPEQGTKVTVRIPCILAPIKTRG